MNRLAAELQEGSRAAIGALPIRRERVPIDSLLSETIRSAAANVET